MTHLMTNDTWQWYLWQVWQNLYHNCDTHVSSVNRITTHTSFLEQFRQTFQSMHLFPENNYPIRSNRQSFCTAIFLAAPEDPWSWARRGRRENCSNLKKWKNVLWNYFNNAEQWAMGPARYHCGAMLLLKEQLQKASKKVQVCLLFFVQGLSAKALELLLPPPHPFP
jgi:hypothetical protein